MNSFGRNFRVSLFGESHGTNVGVTIDGVPAGLPICADDFTGDIARRKTGAKGTSPRVEMNIPNIISGVFNDHANGDPITIIFSNTGMNSKSYDSVKDIPRPSHADFVAAKKFRGFEDYRGGGHFSGRITIGLVVAGVIAKKIIAPIEVKAEILEVGGSANINEAIDNALRERDSIGGIVQCVAKVMPIGLGEPFFDSVESVLGHLLFSIPAIKGVEFGEGFRCARMKGSEHNDCYVSSAGRTATNHAGGVIGGISNGNDLVFRVAVKPTASIAREQNTMNFKTNQMDTLSIVGAHDTCIALRIPVIAEAVTAIGLADLLMEEKTHE
jgi:chorismate synthase